MSVNKRNVLRYSLIVAILMVGLFDGLGLTGVIDVRAFSRQWRETWDSGTGNWDTYLIGSCGGQNHSVSGGTLRMRANYGADCFGAYYLTESSNPGMFPRTEDMRVMWRWRYPDRSYYGTQAGQLTGNYGWPQYYGMSALDVGSGNDEDSWHALTDGDWGTRTVDNALTYGTDEDWHVSTFDWLCDGAEMEWWLDSSSIHSVNDSSYAWPDNHESRPYQFWQGNLLTNVPSNNNWTEFDIDYLYVYVVERPQMNTPAAGGGGTQVVTWNTVPNTTQPDGSTWNIQYQVRACNNANCSSVQQTSPWQDGTSYTFSGLPLNQTYYYEARARWVGTPQLDSCWGNTVSAAMTGEAALNMSKTATAQQEPGGTINYSITVQNTGDAPAGSVVIRDPIPSYIDNPSNISNSGSVSGNEIVWSLGTVDAGASVTVSWQGTVDLDIPRTTSQIVNSASVSDNGGHSDTAQASTSILMPDMSLSKTATSPIWPSGQVDYAITVNSIGQGGLRNVVIRDPIPPYISYPTNISHGGSVWGNEIFWNISSLAAGGSQTLTWQGTVDSSVPGAVSQITNNVSGSASSGVSANAQAVSTVLTPRMSILKTAPAAMWPGQGFTYNIVVQNDGGAPMFDVVVQDTVPNYLINVDNISGGGALSGGVITWGLGTMDAGESVALSWEFDVDPNVPASVTSISNTARGTARGGISEQSTAVSDVGWPEMRLDKSAPVSLYPGSAVAYTIDVDNAGTVPMFQTVVTDTIPQYILTPSGISHGGSVSGGLIVWDLGTMAAGESVTLSWHGEVDENIPQYETEIINNVLGTAISTGDTDSATSALGYPEMYLAKSGPARTWPGDIIAYSITLENTGSAPLLEVVITDPVPTYLEDVDVPAGTVMGDNVVWEFPSIEPGEQQTLIWRGTVADDIPDNITLITNRVTGTALGGIEERAEAVTSLLFPNMSLSKSASSEVWPSGEIEFTIHVENTGGAEMESVEIRDFIPDYVLAPVDISHGGVMDGGDEIVWNLGDMAPGASFDLTWQGTVDPDIPQDRTVIRNQVQGTALRGVSGTAESTSLVLYPSLIIDKSGTAEASGGDTVQFTINVQNGSSAPVFGVTVKDFIPEYIIDPGNISGDGRVEGDEIIWEIGQMNGGQSLTLLWEGTIDLSVPLGRQYLDNTAQICDETERFCDTALYRMRLLQADARVTKNATPYGHPGSEVEYIILVQNTGETVLEELVITDPLPDNIEYPHDISSGGSTVDYPFEDEIGVVWRIDSLAVGEIVELRWRGFVSKDTSSRVDAIENVATLTTRRGLEVEGAGSTYIMHPELRLLKRATEEARPGDAVEYSITLENPSRVPAYEVEVHDVIPTYVLTPAAVNAGGEIWADEIYWYFEELAAGQVVTLTWQGVVDPLTPAAEDEVVNTVNAFTSGGVQAEAEAVTDLTPQELLLRKAATAVVQPGGAIAYSLEVENRSLSPITSLTLTDPVPDYVTNPENISGGGSADNNIAIIWEISRIEPGETLSFSWQGTVDREIPVDETIILNEATLSSESGLETAAQARSFVEQPRLAIDKTATIEVGPGEMLDYVITLRNLGQAPAWEVEVSDAIPAWLEAETVSAGGLIEADTVRWAFDELGAGATQVLTWTAVVDRLVPSSETDIVNTVAVVDVAGNSDEAQAVTDLKPQQIFMTKDATPAIYPGGAVEYILAVENRGDAVLYDVTVDDPLPGYVISPTNISGSGNLDGNHAVVWEFEALTPGQVVTMSWQGSVDSDTPDNTESIWNEAALTTGSGLEASARARSLVQQPLLTLDKTATQEAGPDSLVDYVIVLRNRGDGPAYDVELHDPIPQYILDAGGANGSGGEERGDEVYWYFDELAAGEERILSWFGTVDRSVPAAVREIVNTATVEAGGQSFESSAVTNLPVQAVTLAKDATPLVYPGGAVDYTLVVENRGEAVLYDVIVTDPVPGYVINPESVSGDGGFDGNENIVWEIPAMAVGEVMTLTWSGEVERGTPADMQYLVNEAAVSSESGLAVSAQARSRIEHPALVLDKTATIEAGPGEPVMYALVIENPGQAPAYEVEISDPIPQYILDPVASNGGVIQADAITWRFDELAAGEVVALTWSGRVDENVPAGITQIVNTATASDVTGNSAEDQAITNLTPQEAPLLVKDATYEVYPGSAVIYTVTVRNVGGTTMHDLLITDPIPQYVINPAGISGGGVVENNTAVVWRIDTLSPGDTLTLGWQGEVERAMPASETELWNEVAVETGSGLAASARARSFVRHPELGLDKTATVEAMAGGLVEYSLTVENRGDAPAYEVEIHDPIPEYVSRPGSAGGEIRGDEIYWYFERLEAGQAQSLTWYGFVDETVPAAVEQIVNTATAQDMAGNSAEGQAVTNLTPQEAPGLLKEASYEVYPGGSVSYTVTVENRGDAVLYDVVVTDPIPERVINPAGISTGGYLEGNSAVVWEIPAMAAGETQVLTWQGEVDWETPASETEIRNEAALTTGSGLEASAQARSRVSHPRPAIAKTATLSAGPGELVEYTLQVSNLGDAPAWEVEINDPLPEYIIGASIIAPAGELRANEVYWYFDRLEAGEVRTLRWQGFVDPDIPDTETQIVNTATVQDMAGNSDEAQAVTDLPAQVVAMRKDASYEVWPGGTVMYTVTVQNRGDSRLYEVTVRDSIPARIFDPANISGGGYLNGNDEIVWELGAMSAGDTQSLSWQGTVTPDAPASVTEVWNEATLTTGGGLEASAQAKSWLFHPELTLSKRATTETGSGGLVEYTLTLENSGDAPAWLVEVNDPIPDGLIQPSSPDGQLSGDAVTWAIERMGAGEVRTLNWSAIVDPAISAEQSEIVNVATVQDMAGNSDEAQAVTVLAQQDAWLLKEASPELYPGGTVAYTITLRNQGQATLYDVVVRDPLPAAIVPPVSVGSGGYMNGAELVWEIPAVLTGETQVLTWQGTVDPSLSSQETYLWNSASLETGGGLALEAQARSWVRHPELQLDKTATLEAGPGGTVSYTVTVRNAGEAPSYAVEVNDPLPEYIIGAQIIAPAGEVRADAVAWYFERLEAGEEITLSWSGVVDPDIPPVVAQIVNMATIQDMAGNSSEAQAVTRVTQPQVSLSKGASYEVYPGGTVAYTVTVQNRSGPVLSAVEGAALYNVTVTDPVPEYVLDPANISGGGSFDGNETIVWEIPTMAAGETRVLTWQGEVDTDIPAGETVIRNEATLGSESGLGASAAARSLVRRSLLTVDKTATPSTSLRTGVEVGPGGPVEYTIVIRNEGQAPAWNMEVNDPIPLHILDPVVSNGGVVQADAITWRFDELAAGEVITLTWQGKVDENVPAEATQIVNTVTAQAGSEVAEDQAVTYLSPQRVELLKAATYEVWPGGTVVYTVTVQNRSGPVQSEVEGAALYNVTVTDPVPEYVLNPVNISGGGSFDGNETIVWEIAAMTVGETQVLTWQGEVDTDIPAGQTTLWNEVALETESGLEAAARSRSFVVHPDLMLVKQAPLEAGPGEAVTYTLVVENPGQVPAWEITITDPVPEYILNPTNISGGGNFDGNENIVWEIPTMAAGQVMTLTWQGEVDTDIPDSVSQIINTATARDGAGNSDEARAVTALAARRVDIVKGASYEVYPGGTVVYTVTAQNRSGATLHGVTVTDPAPEYVINPTNISGGGSFDGNENVVWEIPTLAAGQVVTLGWQGEVDTGIPAGQATLWNEVTLETESGLEAVAQARSFVHHPALLLDKSATIEAGPGGAVTYTITMQNPGQAPAYDVEAVDTIPAWIVNPAGVTGGGDVRAEAIVWHFDEVAAGESRVVSWVGSVAENIPEDQREIINTATVQDGAGNSDEAEATTLISRQGVEMFKAATYQVHPGSPVFYTITVRSQSDADLYDISVTDPVPEYIFNPTNISGSGSFDGNETINWTIPSLAAGEAVILTWQGEVDTSLPADQGSLTNEAALTTDSGLEASARARSIVYHPLPVIDKTATTEAGPGEPVTYTLVLENPGQAPAYDVEVHDPVPEYILDPVVSDGGVIQADAITWRFDELAAGEVITLSWSGMVDPEIPATVSEVLNTATVSDGGGRSDEDQAVTGILAQRLRLVKDATYLVGPGETLAYTITVENQGRADLYEVVVTDPVPDYVLEPENISGGGSFDGNVGARWEIPVMAAGETQVLTWQGALDENVPADVTEIWNEAALATRSGLEASARARSRVQRPVLWLAKLAPATIGPGGLMTYTLIVENGGAVVAPDVEVHDPIPANILGATDISGGGFVDYLPEYEVQWQLGDLAAGERRTLTWRGTVDPAIELEPSVTTVISNAATAQDATGAFAMDQVNTTVLQPQMELAKQASLQAGPGELLEYTIVVTNVGETALDGLTVRDPLPEYVSHVAGGSLVGDELLWLPDTLDVGQTLTLTWTGRVAINIPGTETRLRNRATATAYPDLGLSAEDSTLVVRPAISLTKQATPGEVDAGGAIVYSLVITNSSAATLFEVTLSDPVPEYLTPIFVNDGASVSGGEITWQVGELAAGDAVAVSWSGQVASDIPLTVDTIKNEAVVTAAAGIEAGSWVTTTVRQPRLALAKSGPAEIQPGELIEYAILVTNTGLAPAQNVKVEDALPDYLTPHSIADDGYEVPGSILSGLKGRIVWEVGSLAAGEGRQVTWQARVAADIPVEPDTVVNRAEASADGGLAASAETSAQLREVELVLTKLAAAQVYAGGEITYTLRLHNRGDGPARQVRVSDPLPEYVAYVPASATNYGGYQAAGQVVTWTFDLLPAGETMEMSWRGQVAVDLPETVAQLTNRAEASALDTGEPVTATVSSDVIAPNVSATLLCPEKAQGGDVLSYTLRLYNSGGTLFEPTLVMTIPDGTAYVSGSANMEGRLESDLTDEWGEPLPDQLRWDLETLGYGEREQATFALSASPALTGHVRAAATLNTSTGAAAASGSCDTGLFTPKLEVRKIGPEQALVNDVIEFTLVVTNTGPVPARNTVLTDTVLPGLDYMPGTASDDAEVVTVEGGDGWEKIYLTWAMGDIAAGESVERTFRAQMYVPVGQGDYPVSFNESGEAEVYNLVVATADRANAARDTLLIGVPRPELTLTRVAEVRSDEVTVTYQNASDGDPALSGPGVQPLEITLGTAEDGGSAPVAVSAAVQAWPGSRIEHTLTGGNTGPGAARQAQLVERLPSGLEILADTISDGGYYDPDQHAVIWALGDLADDQEVVRSYTLLAPLALRPGVSTLENNRAELSSLDAPTVFASASTEISGTFALAAAKLATDYAEPGQVIEYLIRVQNVNANPLDQVVIEDPLLDYTTYITNSASLPPEFSLDGRTLRWNLGMLLSGEIREVGFAVRLAGEIPDWYLNVANRAEITWPGGATEASALTALPVRAATPTSTPAPSPAATSAGSEGSSSSPTPQSAVTAILRTGTVVEAPVFTPTVRGTSVELALSAVEGATPARVQPGLGKSVSTDTVRAGDLTLITWQLTFTNPSPLTIGGLTVRDLLPPGMLYVDAETSQGVIEVSPRSVEGQDTRLLLLTPAPADTATPTAAVSPSPVGTWPVYQTSARSGPLTSTVTPVLQDSYPSPAVTPTVRAVALTATPTPRVYTTLPTAIPTATGVISAPATLAVVGGEALPDWLSVEDLPGVDDVPLTEVVFRLGELQPGGRALMVIRALVLTDAGAGTAYENVSTFAADNMDPGVSNRVSVRVIGEAPPEAPALLPVILPVTGGLLELIDPRTPQGKVSWGVLLLIVAGGGLVWFRRRGSQQG